MKVRSQALLFETAEKAKKELGELLYAGRVLPVGATVAELVAELSLPSGATVHARPPLASTSTEGAGEEAVTQRQRQ